MHTKSNAYKLISTERCDVLVVGAGMVGSTMAVALAGAGLSVVLIDGQDPERALQETFDGRSSAIARGSQQALAGLGLWPAMAGGAEAILDIRVSDGRVGAEASALFLHYDHREVDGTPLGYIVENRVTQRALRARLDQLPGLRLLAPRRIEDLDRAGPHVNARLDDGTALRARLIVGAEGRRSPTREAAGIRTTSWSYPQVGLVATVVHERPHNGVAHENFLPAGPFAMLPMTDGADGTHRSSIVWTERPELVATLLALDDGDFGREIERRFGDTLGRVRPVGGRWSYPLSLMHASRTIDRRLALVGDAAHVIHPIAGQGLNLGLKDVAALAESVVDAWRLGLDPGDGLVLERYQRWRRLDNLVLIAVTDGLNRLFSNEVRLARDLGLAAVNRAPPLKRLFMGHAMGLVGDLPRLIRGEALYATKRITGRQS
jgi:2-octaprenyl-6-methoxyphenol hydroxylase